MKTAFTKGAVCWNGATFHGTSTYNSLHLLNAYFTQYPEDAGKVIISIKGPIKGDENSIGRTVNECLKALDGKKHLDIFQCARVDPRTPIEETVKVLAQCVKSGDIVVISLSEPSAHIMRRAAAVHRIACVEVEFSLYALEMTKNEVATTCE